MKLPLVEESPSIKNGSENGIGEQEGSPGVSVQNNGERPLHKRFSEGSPEVLPSPFGRISQAFLSWFFLLTGAELIQHNPHIVNAFTSPMGKRIMETIFGQGTDIIAAAGAGFFVPLFDHTLREMEKRIDFRMPGAVRVGMVVAPIFPLFSWILDEYAALINPAVQGAFPNVGDPKDLLAFILGGLGGLLGSYFLHRKHNRETL